MSWLKHKTTKRVFIFVSVFVGLNLYGTIGFWLIEDITLFEAFYMAAITFTTVGYGEVIPLSPGGRMFAISTIYIGLLVSGLSIAYFSQIILRNTFQDLLKGKRMQSAIKKLHDHFIVCGYGITGKQLVHELVQMKQTVVVIDQFQELGGNLPNVYYICGDARQDETLNHANIEHARGLATVLSHDADNVFVVLTARSLNSRCKIVSRFKDDDTQKKLRAAGADEAISPYRMGGQRLAHGLSQPIPPHVLNTLTKIAGAGMRLAYVPIAEGHPIKHKCLRDSEFREASLGALLLAVEDELGNTTFNPDPDFVLESSSKILALGDDTQIEALRDFLGGTNT